MYDSIWEKEWVMEEKRIDISRIESELIKRFREETIDPFCAFVLGKIWKQKNDTQQASTAFLYSIQQFPYFWCCWVELASIITDSTFFNSLCTKIPNQFILKYFFQLYTTNRLMQVSSIRLPHLVLHCIVCVPDSDFSFSRILLSTTSTSNILL